VPTTAGTHLLHRNIAADAFIIQIKTKAQYHFEKQTCEWANFLSLHGS
jgi:hypothetical protein